MKSYLKSFLWLPALVGFLIYLPCLQFGSTWGDDVVVISPQAKDFHIMLRSFYQNLPGSHFFPFSFFQCYLINSIFDKNAFTFGFHLYGLVIHTITCLIATLVFYKLTKNKLISILIILLWTVHPINVESITRLVCIPAHLPSATFALAFFLCFLKAREQGNFKYKIILATCGILFFLASITSYEQYILFPFVLLLTVLLIEDKKILNKKYYFDFFILPIVAIYVTYFFWRYYATGGKLFETSDELIKWTEVGSIKDILFRTFWLAPQLLIHYFRLFFWPDFLSETQADWYKVGESVWSPYSLFCQILILSLTVAAFLIRKKIPLFSIGIFWFFITMLPAIQIFPLFTITDEHYCYLSMLGILLAIFSIVQYYQHLLTPKKIVILVLPIFCLLSWRTIIYLPSHKDIVSHAISMAKYSPSWTKPIYIFEAIQTAHAERREGDLPAWINLENLRTECSKWLQTNLFIKPNLSQKFGPMRNFYKYKTYEFLFEVLYKNNLMKELDILMNQASKVKNDAFGFCQSALFLKEIRSWEKAWESLKKAVEINPRFNYIYSLPFIEIALNADKYKEAEQILKNYIKLKPDSAHPYLVIGLFYNKYNKTQEALRYLTKAISKGKTPSTNFKVLYYKAVDFFIKEKEYDLAKRSLNIVSSFDPYDNEVKQELSKIRALEKEPAYSSLE